MVVQFAIEQIQQILDTLLTEERVLRLVGAWLLILRDEYSSDRNQFSSEQINFLRYARGLLPHLQRFVELQEELEGSIGLDEYNEAQSELQLLKNHLGKPAVGKRIDKEMRQLKERRDEVLRYEQSNQALRRTHAMADLEDLVEPCPNNRGHRLTIRSGKHGYFWGCGAFPNCWYTRPLTAAEVQKLADMRMP